MGTLNKEEQLKLDKLIRKANRLSTLETNFEADCYATCQLEIAKLFLRNYEYAAKFPPFVLDSYDAYQEAINQVSDTDLGELVISDDYLDTLVMETLVKRQMCINKRNEVAANTYAA
ncbi:hypothetical protein [Vibrio comitans]